MFTTMYILKEDSKLQNFSFYFFLKVIFILVVFLYITLAVQIVQSVENFFFYICRWFFFGGNWVLKQYGTFCSPYEVSHFQFN